MCLSCYYGVPLPVKGDSASHVAFYGTLTQLLRVSGGGGFESQCDGTGSARAPFTGEISGGGFVVDGNVCQWRCDFGSTKVGHKICSIGAGSNEGLHSGRNNVVNRESVFDGVSSFGDNVQHPGVSGGDGHKFPLGFPACDSEAGKSRFAEVGKRGVDHGAEEKRTKRQEKRERQRKSKLSNDWRKRDGGDMIEQDQSPGTFWNSTSAEVRQRLIDSKAKMHIAENEKREREARERIAYLESPEAAMHKAIGMIDYAQKQAKKENDNKVYGWAKTVATSSAESLARSTPDSVPSFDEVSARIEASSQSSLELELKAKQDELDDERRKNALLENEIREEKKAKEEVVAKSKHEAVVHRMRQLETQISENNKKAERVNFRRNRVEEMRNAQGETEKQMRARMAKLSPEEHQREVVRLMRERAWENS